VQAFYNAFWHTWWISEEGARAYTIFLDVTLLNEEELPAQAPFT